MTMSDDNKSVKEPSRATGGRDRARWVWFAVPIAAAVVAMVVVGWWLAGGEAGGRADGSTSAASVSTTSGGTSGGGVQLYQSGMHPWIITTEPGNCPICGMKLEPIDASKLTGELAIDPTVVQNMGVRTEAVVTGPLTQTIRTVGRVTVDETGVRTINTKIDGWIEELWVDTEGERVEAGDPLFSVYSPQLYAAQEEYLAAWRRAGAGEVETGSADGLTSAATGASGGEQLLDAARQRLRYFDLSNEQITALEERGEPQKAVTVASPFTGVVTQKHANEGMRIDPGMPVYTLADLSRVWVQATVYERQLPFLREGAAATMTLDYLPGRKFEGVVEFIYPTLEQGSREVRVRLAFENRDRLLKPGMFATVRIEGEAADVNPSAGVVLAPRSAIIDTGERQVAFVALGGGRFEPRELELGVSVDDDRVQVLSGLEPGERVVTSGQFLLDSESRLRESLAKMVSPTVEADSPDAPVEAAAVNAPPAEARDAEPLPAEALRALLAAQTHCPVTGLPLGSMGPPVEVAYRGETVRLCCDGCVGAFEADPAGYIGKLREGAE